MIVRRGERGERPSPVRRVLVVGLAGLILGALLNADSILERAEQKPFGWQRDAWVAIWKPVDFVSHILFLDRPRAWLDEVTGRNDGPGDNFVFPAQGATQTPGVEPTPTPTPAPLRQPTAEEPLRVWIGGDSQAQVFGESLMVMAGDTGLIDAHHDYRISSGLTRPDYFNWPAHLADEMEQRDPEVVVIIFGANDSQGIKTAEGDIYQPFDQGWIDEYRLRVAGTMDLLRGEGRIVLWVGQPIAADWTYSQNMAELNAIYQEEADKRPWVRYVDAWALFADDSGNYAAFLPDDDGDIMDMRQGDGIHLTRAGGDRLAAHILDRIREDFDLEPAYSPPAGTPSPGGQP